MKINCVEIHNILSIENASLKFQDTGLVLVKGFDYDTGRANGAGKSSIFNAISFALFEKIPRKITKSDVLRKGTKLGYSFVEVETSNGTIGVRRERPSKVTYYINGKESPMTQSEFEAKIGMNYEQFIITMYTAQDSSDKFITLNDIGKKNFLLNIMNLSEFTKHKDGISKQISELESQDKLLSAKLEGFQSNIEIYKSAFVDPTSILQQIESNKQLIQAGVDSIKQLELIEEPDLSKYTDVENKISDKLTSIHTAKTMLNLERTELARLKNQTPDTSCPECNVDLNIVSGGVIKADNTDGLQDRIQSVANNIKEYENQIAEESSLLELRNKVKLKKAEEYKSYQDSLNSISAQRNQINLRKVANADLQTKIENNDSVKANISKILNDIDDLNKKQNEIGAEILLLKSVESVFDSTGAPAYIMDSIIEEFNEAVSEFIDEIWPNASYSLKTYKENKDKSIKAKFSETLTINGKERSIGSLSGGEMRALSLALDFSIVQVLSSKYGLSLNPIILDEPFNGLDSVGREMVVDILMKFSVNRQVWVVDHASESQAMFNHTVTVEKRNGISKIA